MPNNRKKRRFNEITECRLACRMLLCHAFNHLHLQTNNLHLELLVESGPVPSAVSQVRNANRIYQRVTGLYTAKLQFKDMLDDESPQVNKLLPQLAALLERFRLDVIVLLGQARGKSERALKPLLRKVARHAKQISIEAKKCLDVVAHLYEESRRELTESIASGSQKNVLDYVKKSISEARCSVVSVDMSQYGRLGRTVEETMDVKSLLKFNQDIIADFVGLLRQIGLTTASVPMLETGDGALIFFSKPLSAVRFAERLQALTFTQNATKDDQNKKFYRIGIATGPIAFQATSTNLAGVKAFKVAGTTIARAVRLQAGCKTGAVVVCRKTWAELPETNRDTREPVRDHYAPMVIQGKNHEKMPIDANGKTITSPAPWDNKTVVQEPRRNQQRRSSA